MQEKVEIITNHIVHFWTILDKNTQKRILWAGRIATLLRHRMNLLQSSKDPYLPTLVSVFYERIDS